MKNVFDGEQLRDLLFGPMNVKKLSPFNKYFKNRGRATQLLRNIYALRF